MALTQISTNGVKDNAVTSGKIPANAVGSSELADDAVDTAAIVDDAVTADKLANSINTAIAANTAKTTNATHTGDVTGSSSLTIASNAVTTAKIADEAVTLAKLEHGTSSNDGKFLRANNGADPTFETVSGTTINSNADNRLITGSGTANTLNAETSATFSSGQLKILTDGASGSGIRLVGKSGNSGSEIDFVNNADNSVLGYIEFSDAGTRFWNQTNTDITIRTNNTERLRVLAGGGLTFNGDTAAANALDDYEEGTYDGTLSVTSGTLVMDTSHNQLSYTKIGRQCTITGRVQVSSVSGLSGYMTMNLPFSVGASSEYDHGGAGSIFMYNAGGVGSPGYLGLWTVWTDGGLSQVYFTYGDSTTAVLGAKVSAGTEVRLTFTYFTS